MNIGSAIRRFENRSKSLIIQAWAFLLVVLGLMAFGGYVVFTASSLTARDIGKQDYDKQLEKAETLINKLGGDAVLLTNKVREDQKTCGEAYVAALGKPETRNPAPSVVIRFSDDELPNGDEIARRISAELAKSTASDSMSVRLSLGSCNPGMFDFGPGISPPALASLANKKIIADPSIIGQDNKAQQKLYADSEFEKLVRDAIYNKKVAAAASGSEADAPPGQPANSDLLLRLIQTSITRFGVLAVIGFLVSILVSLYRYNVRLAAFYEARADVLRLCGEQTSVSDFALMAVALSPQLEFGKVPPTPIAQLADLIKSVKDAK